MKIYLCVASNNYDYGIVDTYVTVDYNKATKWCNKMITGYIGDYEFEEVCDYSEIEVWENEVCIDREVFAKNE